jgi:N-acetylglucosamine kinase-like BadF-type ATPase
MATKKFVIGVDGGGTSTDVVLANGDGDILGVGKAGPGNYHNVGIRRFQDHLRTAVRQAWDRAQAPPVSADAIFLGLGSVVTAHDRETIRQAVAELDVAAPDGIRVDHDLRVGLAGALPLQEGIVLVAGTGSACYGRTADGRSWRAGGWGPFLDDLGSSFDLGRNAMVAAVRDYDGRGPATLLSAAVRERLQLHDIQEIMFRVDGEGLSRTEVAALAPLVTTAARAGDAVALSLLEVGAGHLAAMARAVFEQLFGDRPTPTPIAAVGGLVQAGETFLGPLRRALAEATPQLRLLPSKLPPAAGAALLAIEQLGLPLSDDVVERLGRQAPLGDATGSKLGLSESGLP